MRQDTRSDPHFPTRPVGLSPACVRRAFSRPGRVVGLLAGLALLAGCASRMEKMVEGRLEIRSGTNTYHITQPKDLSIESFEIDPSTGRISIQGYQSAANVAAIEAARAQSKAVVDLAREFIAASERGAVRYMSGGMISPTPGPASPLSAPISLKPQ